MCRWGLLKSNLGSCRFKATMTWIQKKVQRSVVHSVFDLEAEWVPLRKCSKMICDHWNRCSNQGIVWLDTRRSGKSSVWKRILSAKNLRTFTLHPSNWNYVCLYVDIHWIRLDRVRCESILHEVTEWSGAAAAVAAQKDTSGPLQSFPGKTVLLWNLRYITSGTQT